MQNSKISLALVVVVIIAIGGYLFPNVKQQVTQVLGANPGPTHTEGQEFLAGVLFGKANATSTTATTQTLAAVDLVGADGYAYDTVLMTPNTGATTFTLPASSTLKHFISQPGQVAEQCWVNSTTTAAATIIFAAGTGIDLETSSSTPSDLTLVGGNTACLKFIRQKATASTYDITVLMTEYSNGD